MADQFLNMSVSLMRKVSFTNAFISSPNMYCNMLVWQARMISFSTITDPCVISFLTMCDQFPYHWWSVFVPQMMSFPITDDQFPYRKWSVSLQLVVRFPPASDQFPSHGRSVSLPRVIRFPTTGDPFGYHGRSGSIPLVISFPTLSPLLTGNPVDCVCCHHCHRY